MKRAVCVLSGIMLTASASFGQGPGGGAPVGIAVGLQRQYAALRTNLMQSAEKMSEADYSFKPTNEIRGYGQLWGHVANAQFNQCAQAKGVASPSSENFEQKTTKAEFVKALADSFAFCDKAYAAMTNDVVGGQDVTMTIINNMKTTRAGAFAFNSAHDMEHYGNLVTYMRMNKMVPPSSAPPAK